VQRYGRGFPNIPPCALGVDISHLSAGLLMFLRAGKTGEDFRTTAWDMAHEVGRDPPSPRMIPKHFRSREVPWLNRMPLVRGLNSLT
jgi:hypothetical protein